MSKQSIAQLTANRPIKNIVVFMPSFMGDSVNCTPALQMLREHYADATIHLVIRNIANVFTRDADIHCIIDNRHAHAQGKLAAARELVDTLKQHAFDACILMTNRFIDALIVKLAGIPIRIGYKQEMRGKLLTHALKMDRNRHYINRYAYLANTLCDNAFERLPRVSIQYQQNSPLLTKGNGGYNIGLCILSKHKLSRHYPVTQTVDAIGLLDGQINDAHYFMLGAPVEQAEAEAVVKLSKEQGIDSIESLAGKTTITELIDIVGSLDLLITVDSAALHIASATQTPVVVKTFADSQA